MKNLLFIAILFISSCSSTKFLNEPSNSQTFQSPQTTALEAPILLLKTVSFKGKNGATVDLDVVGERLFKKIEDSGMFSEVIYYIEPETTPPNIMNANLSYEFERRGGNTTMNAVNFILMIGSGFILSPVLPLSFDYETKLVLEIDGKQYSATSTIRETATLNFSQTPGSQVSNQITDQLFLANMNSVLNQLKADIVD